MPQSQNQQQVPVEALISIIGEQTIENRMLRVQLAQVSQLLKQSRASEEKKKKINAKAK